MPVTATKPVPPTPAAKRRHRPHVDALLLKWADDGADVFELLALEDVSPLPHEETWPAELQRPGRYAKALARGRLTAEMKADLLLWELGYLCAVPMTEDDLSDEELGVPDSVLIGFDLDAELGRKPTGAAIRRRHRKERLAGVRSQRLWFYRRALQMRAATGSSTDERDAYDRIKFIDDPLAPEFKELIEAYPALFDDLDRERRGRHEDRSVLLGIHLGEKRRAVVAVQQFERELGGERFINASRKKRAALVTGWERNMKRRGYAVVEANDLWGGAMAPRVPDHEDAPPESDRSPS